MKVTYLYHSGFLVELEKHILLFDYYKGELPEFSKDKTIYVFASHKHQDHFAISIFALFDQYEHIHYFLGSDIRLSDKYLERKGIPVKVKEKLTNLGADKTLKLPDIEIRTLRSTDAGVAFCVLCEGKSIYHAGDLNDWYWEGETEAYKKRMKAAYEKEIDKIAGTHFHAAFVPLDPRLEKAYGYGMDYFLRQVGDGCDAVFPMHMWEHYEYIDLYKETEIGKKFRDKIVNIDKKASA
ncbi:MAG: MBL fold metallo-hydrolase [Lachnospiraceae bacterium]|nr:MBL fold metallo-hydrolase [Lachnospiraceae bacterium]